MTIEFLKAKRINPQIVRNEVTVLGEYEYKNTVDQGWDHEAAHSDEDKIHRLVLQHIGNKTARHPAACAREALKSLKYDFYRWTA